MSPEPVQHRPSHPLAPFLQPARRLIRATITRLPEPVAEFVLFGLKMAWSCLFGGALLVLMIVTALVWPDNAPVHRYDFLLLCALLIQAMLVWTRLETVDEVKVIFLYHLTGTVMEIFKTHMGSWTYPEEAVFRIAGVPLFTGFMYGSVGSFIARAIRVFDMRFSHYPKAWITWLLAIAIYVNFFTHHFVWDARYVLFALIAAVFLRSFVFFRIDQRVHSMPFLLAGTLTAFFLWLAENVGTLTRTWVYAGQATAEAWRPVSLHKMGAWGLLLIISFVTVSLIFAPKPPEGEAEREGGYRAWWRRLRSADSS